MNQDRLLERLPATLSRRHPERAAALAKELGGQLCEEYRKCALRFKEIAKCTKPRVTSTGSITTPFINLGFYNHPKVGQVRVAAQLHIDDYSSLQHSPYSVTTHFAGQMDDQTVDLGHEVFGSARFSYTGDQTPTFVRNPYTDCTEPWDIGESGTFGFPMRHTWTMDTYRYLFDELSPMIMDATETQDMIIAAMQDPTLNPSMAEAAARLTGPGIPSVIV